MAIDDMNVGPQKFEPFTPPEEAPPKQGKGCFFWGCLITSILLVLLIIAIVVGVFMARNAAINALKQYTQDKPMDLPVVNLDAQQQDEILKRWADFKSNLKDGKAAEIALNTDELNTVLFHDMEEAKGKVYFRLNGDKLEGDFSVPVEAVGEVLRTQELNGRYFNATGSFNISFANKFLVVTLQDATVNGQPLPREVMQGFQNQNWAESFMKDPDNQELLESLETLEIKEGVMTLKCNGTGEGAETTEAKAEGEATPEAEAPAEPEATPEAEAPAEPEATPEAEAPAEPEAKPEGEAPATEEPKAEEGAPRAA